MQGNVKILTDFKWGIQNPHRLSRFLTLAFALHLSSCRDNSKPTAPDRIPQEEALSIVEEITTDYPNELEAITKDPVLAENFPFTLSLYVDQSQSMRGYIPPNGGNRFYDGSNFIALLHALGNQAELNRLTNAKSFGNGLPQGAPTETLPRAVDLMKPDQKDYNLLSNDYASQIDEIIGKSAPDEISLILTDGVQSYETPSGGSLMGATARSLKKWIARGGYVETLLSTAPFKGKYFSEELRATGREYTLNVEYPNRPFVVFVLIPSAALLDEWDDFKKRDRLKNIEFVSYRLPQTIEAATMPSAAPAMVTFSPEESEKIGLLPRKNAPYARLDPVLPEKPWGKHLHTAFIDRKALNGRTGKPISNVPIILEVTAPAGWKGEFDSTALSTFRPILRVFERSGAKDATSAETRPQKNSPQGGNIMDRAGDPAEQTGGKSEELVKNWKLTKTLDLRAEDTISQNSIPASGENPQKLQLCYMLPWSGEQDLICALEMIAPTASVEPPRFDTYSTTDDSTPEQLNKVYNLATLMGQLAKDENKTSLPSGFLLLIRSAQ